MIQRAVATIISVAISLVMLFTASRCELLAERCRCGGQAEYEISPYDYIMKAVNYESGIDWRLLSAIAHTESHFREDAVSERGAVGLMQIMPHIGEYFGLPAEELIKPHNNVRAAAALLEEIWLMIEIPEKVSEEDALSILLACYNGGLGHVADARRLTRAYGGDMNSWEEVSHCLSLKGEPEYYEHEVVSYGKFTGSRQTIAYVRDVMHRYRRYCAIAEPVGDSYVVCEAPCPIHGSQSLL